MGIDLGKWLCHWSALQTANLRPATDAAGAMEGTPPGEPTLTPTVIDYGRFEVPSDQMDVTAALLVALRQFRDQVCLPGWLGPDGQTMRPRLVLIDAGDWPDVVIQFCAESGPGFLPAKGFGTGQLGRVPSTMRKAMYDPGYEAVPQPPPRGGVLVEINADRWKSRLHDALQIPLGRPGALALFAAPGNEHASFARHLTAEKRVEEFIAGKGLVTRWQAVSRQNHWLDSTCLAFVAEHGTRPAIVPAESRPVRLATDEQRDFVPDPLKWR